MSSSMFILNRNKVVSSTLGHTIEFEKNKPTYVPKEMWAEVMAIGALPEEELPEEKLVDNPEPSDPAAREKKIMGALETLSIRRARTDFNAAGLPNIPAIKALIGFEIGSKERNALWQKYQDAIKEAEAE